MKRRERRRLNGFAKRMMILFLALITLAAVGFYALMPQIPESLKKSRNQGSEETIEVERIRQDGAIAAVFYPVLNSAAADQKIQQSCKELKERLSFEEEAILKVDYTMTEINDRYLSLVFDATSNLNDEVYYRSLLFDQKTQSIVSSQDLLDQTILRKISLQLRNTLKKMDSMQESAYTLDFYRETSSIPQHFETFGLTENTLSFYFDANLFGNHPALQIDLSLAQIANHLNADFGVEQTVADAPVELPERVIDPDRPMVALTFDDGPHKQNMPLLVDLLEQYGQVATFYLVGNRISGNEEIIREMISNGNEAASHSYSHPKLTKLNSSDLAFQFSETSRLIRELTQGIYEVKTVRPPYGAVNSSVKAASPYPLVLWSIDTLDWKTKDAQNTVKTIMENVKDGDIILMHEIHQASVEAAEQVIPQLIDAGYQLVTVSELMEYKGISMEAGVCYRSAHS